MNTSRNDDTPRLVSCNTTDAGRRRMREVSDAIKTVDHYADCACRPVQLPFRCLGSFSAVHLLLKLWLHVQFLHAII